MSRVMGILSVALLALVTGSPGDDKKPSQEQPKVVKDTVKGSIHHGSGGSVDRIVGAVTVIDANTLEFADGTRVALDMVAHRATHDAETNACRICGNELDSCVKRE